MDRSSSNYRGGRRWSRTLTEEQSPTTVTKPSTTALAGGGKGERCGMGKTRRDTEKGKARDMGRGSWASIARRRRRDPRIPRHEILLGVSAERPRSQTERNREVAEEAH